MSEMNDPTQTTTGHRPPGLCKPDTKRFRVILKMMAIAALVLSLLIPLLMVQGVIDERHDRKFEVDEEIAQTWAGRQTVVGPFIVVPYKTVEEKEREVNGKTVTANVTQWHELTLLPDTLTAAVTLKPEVRHRGIYDTTVYTSQVVLKGHFDPKPLTTLGIKPADMAWHKARLVVGIPSVKGINKRPELSWQGQPLELEPGTFNHGGIGTGLSAPLNLASWEKSTPATGSPASYQLTLDLKGSQAFGIAPVGKQSHLSMDSTWPSPSFMGNTLPNQRHVTPSGFTAAWDIPYFARDYGQVWLDETVSASTAAGQFNQSSVGVELFNPVDFYHQCQRAAKYGILFLVLTFATFFLFEVLSRASMHLFQYMLVGFSLCLFYLLLVALAEVVGFGWAYGCAASATVLTISMYTKAILGPIKPKGHWLVLGLLSLLYGYLYVLLQLEDLSLLFGTLGLFVVLVTIMYVTRRIDWSVPPAPMASGNPSTTA